MNTKSFVRLSAWLLLLPAGIVALTALRPHGFLPFDSMAFGFVSGVVKGGISDQERGIRSSFEGRTEPRWSWSTPDSFQYKVVEIRWSDSKGSGEGNLDLGTMLLDQGGSQVPVDAEWFYRLLRNRPLADECVAILDDARTGSLPAPGGLPRAYNRGSLKRFLDHRTEGWQLPYSTVAWTVLWLVATAWICCRRTRLRQRGEPAAS